MKKIVKDILPPALFRVLKQLKPADYGWTGNYNNWQSAVTKSDGYDNKIILKKVSEALQKVKDGEATFERDSVLFDKPEYNWPLISALLYVAANHEGKLEIIDFGGSLGSTYFQNRPFFKGLKQISWNVIEQPHFVQEGNSNFSSTQLKFYNNIEDCFQNYKIETILFSSVLQYIEKPYDLLEQLLSLHFKTVIIDRMPFNTRNTDRITVQKVHPSIYKASYPCHLLNLEYFEEFFLKHNYKQLAKFDAIDGKSDDWQYKGFIFERN
jgi:putative methyltransferase (TIGR04325 family)